MYCKLEICQMQERDMCCFNWILGEVKGVKVYGLVLIIIPKCCWQEEFDMSREGGESSRRACHRARSYQEQQQRPLRPTQPEVEDMTRSQRSAPLEHEIPRSRDDLRDQVGGEDGIPMVNALGQGTSTSQRTGQGRSQPMVRVLQQQIADLRAYSETLQTLVHKQNVVSVQYEVCSWQHIKPHMRMMSKQLILGLDPERSKLKPLEEHIKESIFEVFDVLVHDEKQRKAFERSWVHEIRKKVLINLNNRRGRFSTNARLELWRLLRIPKPVNATPEEMDTWKDQLKAIGVICHGG